MVERPLHYSDIKPLAQFAKDHWSRPGVDHPFHGFEDKTPDKKEQLKACRRQVWYFGTYFMQKGETPASTLEKVKEVYELEHDAPR
ncbi:MAG TPA: hypothetical protein VN711_01020 [Candidatus Saccharimonadales bacterium]|nr:hypothetical protein [Candidatus Saccharimonadales bacterium]